MASSTPAERRKSFRIALERARAKVVTDRSAGTYRLVDVSVGGARLRGSPPLPVGTPLELSVHLPGKRMLEAHGHVLRQIGRGRGARADVAIAFEPLGAEGEDAIEDTVLRHLRRSREAVVVFDEPSRRSGPGLRAVRAATPLGAISALESAPRTARAVLLGPTVGGVPSEEFAAFLADAYPHISRVFLPSASTSGPSLSPAARTVVGGSPAKGAWLLRLLAK